MNAQTKTPELAELVVIEEADALATFTDKAKLDPILAKVRAHIDAFEGDASTASGRKQILAMTTAVVKSKTALKAIGERLAREAKELPKKIDAGRRHVEDTLDAWRDEVREPLTDWETAEDARVKRHSDALDALKAVSVEPPGDVAQLKARIAEIETVSDGEDREEFLNGFKRAKAEALASLRDKLAWREKYDAEQAELAKLRAAAAAREAEEAERRQIAAEAEAKAEAERKAAADAARAAEIAVERERQRVEQERVAAERRAQAEREAAERREADLKAQAEAAERRARDAEARAKAEFEAAAAAERAEQERREKDKAHRTTINRAAVAALVKAGVSEDHAKIAVTSIAKGEVPAIRIHY
jgi:hypothetical protein